MHSLTDLVALAGPLKLAVNGFGSCSGWILFLSTLAKFNVENPASPVTVKGLVQTGAHVASLRTVANRELDVDIAAIDCVSLALIRQHHPHLLAGVRVIGWTEPMLAPPFATSSSHTVELQNKFRSVLAETISNPHAESGENHKLVQAKKTLLLAGIDTSVTKEHYIEALNAHLAQARQSFSHLLDFSTVLRPGYPLRNQAVVNGVEVELTSRANDAAWYEADPKYMHTLFIYLTNWLLSEVISRLPNQQNDEGNNGSSWSTGQLVHALESLVDREIYPAWTLGGHCKIVLPSTKGLLHYLRALHLTPSVLSETPGGSIVARELAERVQILAAEELVNQFVSENSEGSSVPSSATEKDVIWAAGFMGCAHPNLTEYFTSEDKEDSATAISLNAQLWAADFALTDRLRSIGGALGIWAYISAPRYNDRGDWGNLVLAGQESSLIAWRGSKDHSMVGRDLAPSCYEHIRLHRGVFHDSNTCQNAFSSLQLSQTTFLVSRPAPGPSQSSSAEGTEQKVPLTETMRTLLQTQETRMGFTVPPSTAPASASGAAPLASEATAGPSFQRYLSVWRADHPTIGDDIVIPLIPSPPEHRPQPPTSTWFAALQERGLVTI